MYVILKVISKFWFSSFLDMSVEAAPSGTVTMHFIIPGTNEPVEGTVSFVHVEAM